MHNPFARKRPNPKRTEPRRTGDRVRLKGDAYQRLRWQAYKRAGGLCECDECAALPQRRPALWIAPDGWPDKGDFAHDEHGSRKSDELDRGKWMRHECHMRSHNAGGKPVARKPGRKMNKKDAEEHWKGTVCCFCKGEKAKDCTFCDGCWCKLSAQSRHDLLNTDCTGDYLQAVADAETELLVWKPAEEQMK